MIVPDLGFSYLMTAGDQSILFSSLFCVIIIIFCHFGWTKCKGALFRLSEGEPAILGKGVEIQMGPAEEMGVVNTSVPCSVGA